MKNEKLHPLSYEAAKAAEAWVRAIQWGTPEGRKIVERKRREEAEWKKHRPLA